MSDLTKNKDKKPFLNTRVMVSCAMLAACSVILTWLEIQIPFLVPNFIRLNIGDLPVLIGAFAYGPIAGIVIEFIRCLIGLFLNFTNPTSGVGELSNFILGCAFILPASIIYRHKKTKKNAVIGIIIGSLFMAVISIPVNALVILPLYAKIQGLPLEAFFAELPGWLDFVDSVWKFCAFSLLPFNLIKALLISCITMFIYKPLSILLKGISNY